MKRAKSNKRPVERVDERNNAVVLADELTRGQRSPDDEDYEDDSPEGRHLKLKRKRKFRPHKYGHGGLLDGLLGGYGGGHGHGHGHGHGGHGCRKLHGCGGGYGG